MAALSVLGAAAPAQARGHARGSVVVEVTELPHGVSGAVSIRGPRGTRRVRRTTTLRGAPAGAYTVKAQPVATRRDTFYPTIASCPNPAQCRALPRGRARLTSGGRLTVYVVYQDMVPKTTKVLSAAAVRRIRRGLSPSGELIFSGAGPLPFSTGSVVVAAPTPALPYGILRKVTGVSRHAADTVVSTTAATLADAVPRGSLDLSIHPRIPAGARDGNARLGFATEPVQSTESSFPCSVSAISVDASEDMPNWSFLLTASWGLPAGPSASISGSFVVNATVSVTAGLGINCEGSTEFPASPNPGAVFDTLAADIGPVPVWVTPELVGELSYSGNLTTGLTLSSGGTATVQGGVAYANGAFSNSFSVNPSFDPSSVSLAPTLSADAELTVGPKLYFDVDDARQFACEVLGDCSVVTPPYLELKLQPEATLQPDSDPWWRLDGDLSVGVGFQLPWIHLNVSHDFELAKRSILAPPGRPTSVSATAGDGRAMVSWQAPPANPATPPQDPCACLPVSGYTVLVNGKPGATTSGATSTELTGLTDGVPYQVTVQSDSAQGISSGPSVPITVTAGVAPPAVGATTLSAGWDSPCAILSGGAVYCWGSNSDGQLGNGSNGGPESCAGAPCGTTPVPVPGLNHATAISTGASTSCAVLTTGHVDCWGGIPKASPTEVRGITNATGVADDTEATCAVLATGSVVCWGDNSWGELGDGSAAINDPSECEENSPPVGYPCGSSTPIPVSGITNAVAVTGNQAHACALLATGRVECWGNNLLGELGDGTDMGPSNCVVDPCALAPVTVSGITTAVAISAGQYHTCALLADGHVECWGQNALGELGDGTSNERTTPVTVSGISTAVAITTGLESGCALLRGGSVDCWGLDGGGALGTGTFIAPSTCAYPNQFPDWPCSLTPVPVTGVTSAVAISAGDQDACAVLANGALVCWGSGGAGQLGDGKTDNSPIPVEVQIP